MFNRILNRSRHSSIHYSSFQVPFVSGARCSNWWREDEDGSCRQQLRPEGRRVEEDGGRGQSSWTDTFLCKTTSVHLSTNSGSRSKSQTGKWWRSVALQNCLHIPNSKALQYESPSSSDVLSSSCTTCVMYFCASVDLCHLCCAVLRHPWHHLFMWIRPPSWIGANMWVNSCLHSGLCSTTAFNFVI